MIALGWLYVECDVHCYRCRHALMSVCPSTRMLWTAPVMLLILASRYTFPEHLSGGKHDSVT